jgi:predicted MFS family arabinose efflux permease
MARVAVIGFSGFFFGPPLMGFLAEGFGLRLAFAAIAASCLAALLPLWALRRVPRR